jgi:hypothetical protein
MTHCTVITAGEACTRPTSDNLCAHHRDELVTALRAVATGGRDSTGAEIGGLWDDLQDVVCGRVVLRSGASVASNETEARLPYNASASDLAHALDNTIITWHNVIAEDNPHLRRTATTTEQAAAWLANVPTALATHEAARDMHDEITAIVGAVERMVDRRADRAYLGTCGEWIDDGDGEFDCHQCNGQLYARPNAPTVTCRVCGTRFDVANRRAWMLTDAEDQLLTAIDCARALAGLGNAVSVDTIRTWSHRGRIAPHGHTTAGRPLYRVGDVLDLMARAESTR